MTASVTRLPLQPRVTTSIEEDAVTPGIWRVEATDYVAGGFSQLTVFIGLDAEARARDFASWRYGVPRARPFGHGPAPIIVGDAAE